MIQAGLGIGEVTVPGSVWKKWIWQFIWFNGEQSGGARLFVRLGIRDLFQPKFYDPVTTFVTGCLEQAQLCSVQACALELGTGDFTNIVQVARRAVG